MELSLRRQFFAEEAILGTALMYGPRLAFTRLRRDVHDVEAGYWFRGRDFCFSAA